MWLLYWLSVVFIRGVRIIPRRQNAQGLGTVDPVGPGCRDPGGCVEGQSKDINAKSRWNYNQVTVKSIEFIIKNPHVSRSAICAAINSRICAYPEMAVIVM